MYVRTLSTFEGRLTISKGEGVRHESVLCTLIQIDEVSFFFSIKLGRS